MQMQVPSLDYSNEEELTDDTKLLYENFDKKMDLCKLNSSYCYFFFLLWIVVLYCSKFTV